MSQRPASKLTKKVMVLLSTEMKTQLERDSDALGLSEAGYIRVMLKEQFKKGVLRISNFADGE